MLKQHLYAHFCSSNHYCFTNGVSVIIIDKTDPSHHLKREDYWKSTLKTMALFGLNIEESVWRSLFLVPLLRCNWSGNVEPWEIYLSFFLGIVRIWTYARLRIVTLDNDFHYYCYFHYCCYCYFHYNYYYDYYDYFYYY